MASPFDSRAFLTNFDSRRGSRILSDVLIIGSGVAGLRCALEASRYAHVTIVTKGSVVQSATALAQGGIAAAVGPDDLPDEHFADTMRVGCGLCREPAVRLLVDDAPARIDELIEWGAALDRDGQHLALGREGGHSKHRIVHALGDQTGRELVKVLSERVAENDRIRVFERCFLIDFVVQEGACLGAITYHRKHGHQFIRAKQTILASGGCGQLWRETTNPRVATGDGLAAAFRAGASLCDLEFMQFHPTTLYVAGAGRALITEAVRGEGGHLVDKAGDRFMAGYDKAGELAPRDVVSRSIHHHLRATRANCVFLDVRHIARFGDRFPHIFRLCADFEIDVTKDLIPVRPTAHYMIGGVLASTDGETNIDRLLCCGEVASTGVHGANRLASNSLLEGLVFGVLTGQRAGQRACASVNERTKEVIHQVAPSYRTELDLSDVRHSLRSLMWRNAGIARNADRLTETRSILDFWGDYTMDKTLDSPEGWETQDLLTVGRLVAMSALERTESIGVHYRDDVPEGGAEHLYHVLVQRDSNGTKTIRSPIAGPVQ